MCIYYQHPLGCKAPQISKINTKYLDRHVVAALTIDIMCHMTLVHYPLTLTSSEAR